MSRGEGIEIVPATADRFEDAGLARAAGAPGVEAYPIDPAGRRVDAGFAFTGVASMFDAAGFRRVLVTDATSARLPRLLVRLDFSPATAAPSGS